MRMARILPQIHIDELPQRCRRRYDRFIQYFSERPDHFLSGETGCVIGRWDAARMVSPRPEDFLPVARKEMGDTGRKLWQLRFADRSHLTETFRRFSGLHRVGLEGYLPRPRRRPVELDASAAGGLLVGRFADPPEPVGSLIETAILRSGKNRAVWVREALLAKARSEMSERGPG